MPNPTHLIAFLIALAFWAAGPVPAQETRSVFFISSYHPGFNSFPEQVGGILNALEEAGFTSLEMEFNLDFMDAKRLPSPEHRAVFRQRLVHNLDRSRPDVLIVGDDDAFEFAVAERRGLFDGIPIVFLGVNNEEAAKKADTYPQVTGIVEKPSIEENIDFALGMADTDGRVAVITDDSRTGRLHRIQFMQTAAFRRNPERFRFLSLSDMTHAELDKAVASLTPDAPIFLMTAFRDLAGDERRIEDAAGTLAALAPAPIVHPWSASIGHGSLGGKVVSHFNQGKQAGRIAAQILNGVPPESIPVVRESPNLFLFDYRVMDRFGIRESDLPPEATILNRPQSGLAPYWPWLGGAAIFVALQSAGIMFLMRANRARNRALQEANRASRAKSEFLAMMSHEFRTPLNAILGFSDVLRQQLFGHLGEDRYRGYADDIYLSGSHMLRLVEDILDLSALEAKEREIKREPIDVGELMEESRRAVAGLAQEGGISLTVAPPQTQEPLLADRRAMLQILLNLLSNAIKFTPKGGTVDVRVERGPDDWVLRVADTGIGIPENQLAVVTEPFRQAHGNAYIANHDKKGTGLGLAIVSALVTLHEGSIDLESRAGQGTTVLVRIPAVPDGEISG